MRRAFARSESLSEPERLFVKASYHYTVTGRLDETVAAYRLWSQTYPQAWTPHMNLATAYGAKLAETGAPFSRRMPSPLPATPRSTSSPSSLSMSYSR